MPPTSQAATRYAIALGSNRRHGRHGAPPAVIAAALAALAEAGPIVRAVSPVVATAALGPAGRRFANAAALIETGLGPPALLALLKGIERAFGRRRGRRWGPRVLDLDILLWSGGAWPPGRARAGAHLVIPHAGMATRMFVLAPLRTIAPGWRGPRAAATVRHLHARLAKARPLG